MLLQYGLYLVLVPMFAWVGIVAYLVRRMDVPSAGDEPTWSRAQLAIAAALCPLPVEACGKAAVMAIGPGGRDGLICFEAMLGAAVPRQCSVTGRASHRLS